MPCMCSDLQCSSCRARPKCSVKRRHASAMCHLGNVPSACFTSGAEKRLQILPIPKSMHVDDLQQSITRLILSVGAAVAKAAAHVLSKITSSKRQQQASHTSYQHACGCLPHTPSAPSCLCNNPGSQQILTNHCSVPLQHTAAHQHRMRCHKTALMILVWKQLVPSVCNSLRHESSLKCMYNDDDRMMSHTVCSQLQSNLESISCMVLRKPCLS